MLFLFGVASIVGNIVAGTLLTKNAMKSVATYPIVLGIVYIFALLMGKFTGPWVIIIVLIWGMLFAIGNNISQYWITSAAPEAPDFANGLFLSCGNLGITIGISIGGLLISGMGTQYITLGGLLFLILSIISIFLRNYMYRPTNKINGES